MKILRVILADQLTKLKDFNKKTDVILMCETMEECTYVKHHKKKLVFILSAMRHFAKELVEEGFNLHYVKLDDPENTGSLISEIERFRNIENPDKVIVTWPGEWRILQNLRKLDIEIIQDERFLATRKEFAEWAKGKKELRMEFFYRLMRQKYNILMDDKKPEGGKWNYDAENRKFPKEKLNIPATHMSKPDAITEDVIKLVEKYFPDHFGDILPFHFAVTRKQALAALDLFINQRLKFFGEYQDAMIQNEPWMYHSHLSFYINIGLLNPLECIKRVEGEYRVGNVSLNSAEGFIRQILGWREYVRGIYWLLMPEYKKENFLKAKNHMPEFYWTAKTDMNCLKQCVLETKHNAYAHHIQRLMILGNFALLAGLDPDEVNEWYLIVYADAYEWVELPNVTGMILFADGGYLASKPYAASGAYIKKMSNYCKDCTYDVEVKTGEKACPFNYLYWDFLIRNEGKLEKNPRLSIAYSSLRKMDKQRVNAIKEDSEKFLSKLKPYNN